jgi:hypothetical protein
MDLNKPIRLELKFSREFLQANLAQISVTCIGLLLCIVLLYLSYEQYERFDQYEAAKAQYLELERVKEELTRKITVQKKKYAGDLQALSSAPKTKTELQSFLAARADQRKIKVLKITAAEPVDKSRDETLEFEFEGSYAGIIGFLADLTSIIGSSSIEKLKLIPSTKNKEIIASISLTYKNPPPALLQSAKASKLQIMHDFEFDSFDNWSLSNAQFVQNEQNNPTGTGPSSSSSTQAVDSGGATRNPFEAPPKNEPATASRQINTVDEPKDSTEKKITAFYLSGILYSEEKRLCVVTLPAGESKIFYEGQSISPRVRIVKIEKHKVIVDTGRRATLKVGDEIPL